MSIPPLSPHRLSFLQPQGISGFEVRFGTKYQEYNKCPPNWKDLGNLGGRDKGNGTLGNVQGNIGRG